MTKCIACARIDMKAQPQFTKVGMVHCPLDPSATFVSLSFERVCTKFQPAPAAAVAARIEWAKKI
jgi:hypothetical protein